MKIAEERVVELDEVEGPTDAELDEIENEDIDYLLEDLSFDIWMEDFYN